MADCSYSRCIQQKRYIRRELQRWTKNMVYIVGLERIAEELMGRRKWKVYQESMYRNYLQPINNNVEKSKAIVQQEYRKDLAEVPFTKLYRDEKLEQVNDCALSSDEKIQKDEEVVAVSAKDKVDEDTNNKRAEERLKDWRPESKCYFCVDGKLDSENTTAHGTPSPRQSDSDSSYSHSDTEAPPTLTPATTPGAGSNSHQGSMATIESVTSMAALASAVAALSGNNPAAPNPHLPFYPPMPHNWYLATMARTFHAERNIESEKTVGGEQPLDLSSKGANTATSSPVDNKLPPNIRLPTLDTKQIFKAKPRMSVTGRRTYTEDELQAALRDIQSGKLGTRRAAVIYGIPRSTLRNKVYKLAMERERESHLNTSTPLKIDEEENMDDEKELSGAEEEKEVEKALQAPLLSMADILRFSTLDNQEALKHLLQRNKEGHDVLTGLEHSAMGPYIQNLILAGGNLFPGQKVVTDNEPATNPLLPEFLKRMMVDDHFKEQLRSQMNNGENDKISRPSPSNSVIARSEKSRSESDMETDESPSNVILKIPSFKPTTSKNGTEVLKTTITTNVAAATEPSVIVSPPIAKESASPPILPGRGMTLKDVKDVIAKSISQKFQQTPEPMRISHMMDIDYKRGGFTPPMANIQAMKTQQDMVRPYQPAPPPPKPTQSTTTCTTTATTGGKGTRPKRGKYRNYDRDSLVEAVRAVQRGEMSVHRAGSYYGVPHSTLEYKVKERHLMRPRKRDPKPNPVDEKIASLKQNDLRNAAEKMKTTVMKPPQTKFPTSPNGMKLPIFDPTMTPLGYTPPPFPFWPHPSFPHIPIDYGRSPSTSSYPPNPEQYFATQMMQKLQEDSNKTQNCNVPASAINPISNLPKSARQMAESLLDSTGTNGSFLDGIIRSSLESGVPTSNDETSPKDEKNLAPENMSNKALLDQLCRNSRLTPLTKPILTESNSSTEENFGGKNASPLNFSSTMSDSSGSGLHSNQGGRTDRECSPRGDNSDVPTIELSNDSNESTTTTTTTTDQPRNNGQTRDERCSKTTIPTTTGRIFLKQELTNPENLKPEMLVRFRDVLHDVDHRNGTGESATGSASESDAAQD